MKTTWLGRLGYDEAHATQVGLRDALVRGDGEGALVLLEHHPVITFGRRGPGGDLIVPVPEIESRGIQVRTTERGGQATYHGPGQVVGYVVARLRELAPDVPTYVWGLEETMIRAARTLGVEAERCHCGHGVFVDDRKLGSIGVAITRGICWHGFALNVDLDLAPFELIRPCGLDLGVTSIAQHASAPSVRDAATVLADTFASVFETGPLRTSGLQVHSAGR